MDSILRPDRFGECGLKHIICTDILKHVNIKESFQERSKVATLPSPATKTFSFHSSMEDEGYPLSQKFIPVNDIYKWTKMRSLSGIAILLSKADKQIQSYTMTTNNHCITTLLKKDKTLHSQGLFPREGKKAPPPAGEIKKSFWSQGSEHCFFYRPLAPGGAL